MLPGDPYFPPRWHVLDKPKHVFCLDSSHEHDSYTRNLVDIFILYAFHFSDQNLGINTDSTNLYSLILGIVYMESFPQTYGMRNTE